MDSFGYRLKRARILAKLTQTQAAKKAGVSVQMWREYEAGRSEPGVKKVKFLSRFDISLNWLLAGDGPETIQARENAWDKHQAQAEQHGEHSEERANFIMDMASEEIGIRSLGFSPDKAKKNYLDGKLTDSAYYEACRNKLAEMKRVFEEATNKKK